MTKIDTVTFVFSIIMTRYRMRKKKPAIVMKGEIKDRHSTLVYFKSTVYDRLFYVVVVVESFFIEGKQLQ